MQARLCQNEIVNVIENNENVDEETADYLLFTQGILDNQQFHKLLVK